MKPTQHPKVEVVDAFGGCGKAEEVTHPSFGQIRAGRVEGHAFLYGSDFRHNHYVTVSISRSILRRDLSHDWPFAKDEIIEVSLSESQWATFVSSLNCGMGVQCTIEHENGKRIPGIASVVDRLHQFKGEAAKKLAKANDALTELDGMIDGLKLSAKGKEELHDAVRMARANLTSNLEFVAKSFSEHVEKTTDKAKAEVNAYIQAMIMRSGIESLQGTSPLQIEQRKAV